jgi:sirohydrochlorin ferrochelatase
VIVCVLADLDATGLVLGPPGHTAFCAEQREALRRRAQQLADDGARHAALRTLPACPAGSVVQRE